MRRSDSSGGVETRQGGVDRRLRNCRGVTPWGPPFLPSRAAPTEGRPYNLGFIVRRDGNRYLSDTHRRDTSEPFTMGQSPAFHTQGLQTSRGNALLLRLFLTILVCLAVAATVLPQSRSNRSGRAPAKPQAQPTPPPSPPPPPRQPRHSAASQRLPTRRKPKR